MYMPFPYCLLFGDIKQLTIEAVAIPIIGGDHKFFSYNNIYITFLYRIFNLGSTTVWENDREL